MYVMQAEYTKKLSKLHFGEFLYYLSNSFNIKKINNNTIVLCMFFKAEHTSFLPFGERQNDYSTLKDKLQIFYRKFTKLFML